MSVIVLLDDKTGSQLQEGSWNVTRCEFSEDGDGTAEVTLQRDTLMPAIDAKLSRLETGQEKITSSVDSVAETVNCLEARLQNITRMLETLEASTVRSLDKLQRSITGDAFTACAATDTAPHHQVNLNL